MTREGKVLIIGAGIGGLTAAVALKQAGREVVVFEQMDSLKEVGAGFTMNSNAVTAIRELGLDKQVEEQGAELTRFVHHTRKGKVIAEWPTGQISANVGAPIIGIGRPDVQRILVGALDGVEIRYGHRFSGARAGRRRSDGDVRQRRLGARRGAGGRRRLALDRAAAVRPDRAALLGLHDLARVGRVHGLPGRDPRTVVRAEDDPRRAPDRRRHAPTGTRAGRPIRAARTPTSKQAVLDLFGDWADPLPRLLQATDPAYIARSDIYDLPRRESWGSGRVTLLGDAAHSMVPALGQGACQAIEDGVVLGRILGGSEDDPAALKAYEQRRIERTAPIVKRARMQGAIMQGNNPLMSVVRSNFFRFAPQKQVLKGFQEFLTFEG